MDWWSGVPPPASVSWLTGHVSLAEPNTLTHQHISNSNQLSALCKEKYWHKCLLEKYARLIIWPLAGAEESCGSRKASLPIFVELTNLETQLVQDSVEPLLSVIFLWLALIAYSRAGWGKEKRSDHNRTPSPFANLHPSGMRRWSERSSLCLFVCI